MEITAVPETVTSAMKEPPQIKSKCIKTLPIYRAGPPSLMPTVGGCEVHASIKNGLGKKEHVINSAMEKSTHPRVKHMPRPWSQEGEQSVEVGEQSGWGAAWGRVPTGLAGTSELCWKHRQKLGGGGRGGTSQLAKPLQTVSMWKSQDWRHAGQPVRKPGDSPLVKCVTKVSINWD